MPIRGRRVRYARPVLTPLEPRNAPAVTATALNGILTVMGDSSGNDIAVSLSGGNLVVSSTGQSFASGSIGTIVVDGGQGNDSIAIGTGITQNCWLFGGTGNDRIICNSSGNNYLSGSNGDDNLQGGPGNDTIYGGAGSDSLVDSRGSNSVNQGSPTLTATLDSLSSQIVTLTNQQRAANGLPALAVSPILNAAAVTQSNQMVSQAGIQGLDGAMQHTLMGVNLPSMASRDAYVGYEYYAIGENIAYGFQGASDVMTAWMNSPGHRANILDSTFTEIGVSVKSTPDGILYFTQEFGKPTSPTTNASAGSAAITINGSPVRKLTAVGSNAGGQPRVTVYDASNGSQKFAFDAYDFTFTGGVRVAVGDVNGDGYDDIITAPGAGGGPHIKVFDGTNGKLIREFFAYDSAFNKGVFIAAGDVNGDGRADIITGAGAGGGPHVRVFSGSNGSELASFFAYSSNFSGGVTVAAGDVNGDGKADVITGAGPGGGPMVRAISGNGFREIYSFYAYSASFSGGVTVAAGDINGDGKADIITGAMSRGAPHVQVFSGTDLKVLRSFYAYSTTFGGGVWVASHDFDGDGKADIAVGGGPGGIAPVRWLSGATLNEIRSFTVDPTFLGGCFVG